MTETNSQSDIDPDRAIAALDLARLREDATVRLASLADFAQAIWRGLTLVNGGAIVALFTLVGNAGINVDRSRLFWAFGMYVGGLGSTLASAIAAYFTQSAFLKQTLQEAWNAQEIMHGRPERWMAGRSYKWGSRTEWASLTFAVCGLLFFMEGSLYALRAVVRSPKATITAAALRSTTVADLDGHEERNGRLTNHINGRK